MANTQGAPTTGLGQNVTFVGDPVTGAPVMSRLDEAEVNVLGSQPRRQAAGEYRQANFQEVDSITSAFTSLGSALASKVKEKEQESFVRGAMDAAQGKTVEQIADEQPWYANLFGPSSAELGAKAYTNQERVNVQLAKIQSQMASLAQLPYEQAREELTNSMNNLLTGNPEEDAFVRQTFLKNMPSLVEDYTKQRVGYVNQLALVSQSRARRSVFELIENDRLPVVAGRMSQEQATARAFALLDDTEPVNGQNLVMWEKTFADDLVAAAHAGYLTSVKIALEHPQGALLTPTSRDRVKAAEKQGNAAIRAKWLDENVDTLAQLEFDIANAAGGTVAENFQKLMAFSEAGRKEMGATEDLYDRSKAMALVKGGMAAVQARKDANARALAQEERAAATAAAKAEVAAKKAAAINDLFALGDVYGLKQITTDEHIETLGYNEYARLTQKNDWAGIVKFLGKFNKDNKGWAFSRIKSQLQAQTDAAIQGMAKAGVTDAGLQQLYGPWKALNDAGLSTIYFGEGLDGKMSKFNRMMETNGGGDIERNRVGAAAAFEDSFVKGKEVHLKEDEVKKLTGGMFSSGLPAFDKLPERARASVLSFLDIGSYPTALEGVQRALPAALASGKVEVFGNSATHNGTAVPVKQFLRDPQLSRGSAERWGLGTFETDDEAVESAFQTALSIKTQGFTDKTWKPVYFDDLGKYPGGNTAKGPRTNPKGIEKYPGRVPSTTTITDERVIRMDQGGKPMLVVMQMGDDGKRYDTVITMEDLYAARTYNYFLKNGHYPNQGKAQSRDLYNRSKEQLIKQ